MGYHFYEWINHRHHPVSETGLQHGKSLKIQIQHTKICIWCKNGNQNKLLNYYQNHSDQLIILYGIHTNL